MKSSMNRGTGGNGGWAGEVVMVMVVIVAVDDRSKVTASVSSDEVIVNVVSVVADSVKVSIGSSSASMRVKVTSPSIPVTTILNDVLSDMLGTAML